MPSASRPPPPMQFYSASGMPAEHLPDSFWAVCGQQAFVDVDEEGIVENTYRLSCNHGERELLLEKIQSSAEDSTPAIRESETLRTRVEDLPMERDNLRRTVRRLGKTVKKTAAANLELQGQLRSANCPLGEGLKERRTLGEGLVGLKGKSEHPSSQASKVQETLAQLKEKTEETREEMEKLLWTVQHQQKESDRQKDLIVEKDERIQKLEATFAEGVAQLMENVTEQRQQAASMQLLAVEKSLLQKEREDLQQAMETLRTENAQLQRNLSESTEKGCQVFPARWIPMMGCLER
ncbi:hypothetical protein lerEdw1_011164 [Lerista edwardsae]|nr:hypothetical protein lerEdw1_011164 [Lerista edwardsae]